MLLQDSEGHCCIALKSLVDASNLQVEKQSGRIHTLTFLHPELTQFFLL